MNTCEEVLDRPCKRKPKYVVVEKLGQAYRALCGQHTLIRKKRADYWKILDLPKS